MTNSIVYIVYQAGYDGSVNLKVFSKKCDAIAFKRGFSKTLNKIIRLKKVNRKRIDAYMTKHKECVPISVKWYSKYIDDAQSLWHELKEYSGNDQATDSYTTLGIEKLTVYDRWTK